jgi:hypothetical protein
VRRVTRRRFSAEEKVRIVIEGFRREVTVNATALVSVRNCLHGDELHKDA